MNSEVPRKDGDMMHNTEWDSESTPAQEWEQESVKRALDELFNSARKYRSNKSYKELLGFIRRFRFYSPYNAMLVQAQMPGARYVAPAHRWQRDFGYFVRPDARPLVILQPMGPVMFVFDVSEVEPGPEARPLPKAVTAPFDIIAGYLNGELELTIENAKRDGIRVSGSREGSQSAGKICDVGDKKLEPLKFRVGRDKCGKPITVDIPVRYDVLINANHKKEVRYATLVHELAHLYCGHLGTPDKKWWPDRRGLNPLIREFEAESAAWLICGRLGIENPSADYLSGYLDETGEIPKISLECVMKVCGLIESMGREYLKQRK